MNHPALNNDWDDPIEGGVLDGPGYRGTYDGPEAMLAVSGGSVGGIFKLVPKLYVWEANHRLEFELTALELARLALPRFVPGRKFVLPASLRRMEHTADPDPVLMRSLLARLLQNRALGWKGRDTVASVLEKLAQKLRGRVAFQATRAWTPTGAPVPVADETDAWIQGLYGMYKSRALKDDEMDEMLRMMSPPLDMAETLLKGDISELMQKMRERHPDFASDEGFMTWFEKLLRGLKKRAAEVHGPAFPVEIRDTVRTLHKSWAAGLSVTDVAKQLLAPVPGPSRLQYEALLEELTKYTPEQMLGVASDLGLAHDRGFPAWLSEIWETMRGMTAAERKPPLH